MSGDAVRVCAAALVDALCTGTQPHDWDAIDAKVRSLRTALALPKPPADGGEAVDDGTCDDGFPHRCGRCDRDVLGLHPPAASPVGVDKARDAVVEAARRYRVAHRDWTERQVALAYDDLAQAVDAYTTLLAAEAASHPASDAKKWGDGA